MASAVIGRDDELEAVGKFLAEVEQGPRALVLSGEPGIGKTILWQAGVDEAERRFARVLVHRGIEAEASLSFAGLSDLLVPVVEDVVPSLAPPRRRALEVALWLADPGELPPEPGAIGLAVFDVLRALAEGGPVLVALDDLQWLDAATAGVLQMALRRLREEPVGLLATLRGAPAPAAPLELDRSFREGRLTRLSPGALNLGAVHDLLGDRLGLELTRPEAVRVQEATAGNPFFTLELGRELVRTGTRPAPGEALPVPESLRELLGGRLARLPGETLDVLLLAAALARPTVELLAAAHGERERVLEALETAMGEAVVEFADPDVRFVHPLLASICYGRASSWKRRAAHRALAGAVSDVEERARHLALAAEGPDAEIASELDRAAGQAAARGATGAAAELSELAAALTDDPALGHGRRLRAATFHRLAGDNGRASALLEELLPEVPPGAMRSDVLVELALTFRVDRLALIELCDRALAEVGADDARAARILAHRSVHRLLGIEVPAALADARAALQRAERADDPVLLAVTIATVNHAEAYATETTPGLLERGVSLEERLRLPLLYFESPRFYLARRLAVGGDLDRAYAIYEELEAEAEGRGDEGTRVGALWYLSMAEWFGGRLQSAHEHATTARELGELTQFGHAQAWGARVKALIEVDLGLVEEARASCAEGLAFARASFNETYVVGIQGALGRLELALGDAAAAAECLRDLPARMIAGGMNEPTLPVWGDAVEALIALGELDLAAAYLDHARPHVVRSGSPLAAAWEARCRALLAAARDDLDGAFAAFECALAPAGSRYRVERGRALLSLGVVCRRARQKRRARETLEQALQVFDELGARPWGDRARVELRRISGRRAPADELTEAERRAADLAAKGRTNREIAAELYMGVSTVEAHLSHAYRKLGIRSRTELAARLADPEGEAAKGRDGTGQP